MATDKPHITVDQLMYNNTSRVVEDIVYRGKRRVIVEVQVRRSCGHFRPNITNILRAAEVEQSATNYPCPDCCAIQRARKE